MESKRSTLHYLAAILTLIAAPITVGTFIADIQQSSQQNSTQQQSNSTKYNTETSGIETGETEQDVTISDPYNYGWETETDLITATGFCYPIGENQVLGTINARIVRESLDSSAWDGRDVDNAINPDQFASSIHEVSPIGDRYILALERHPGDRGDYNMYVILSGRGGEKVYLTRSGAVTLSQFSLADLSDEYMDCLEEEVN